MQLDGYTLEQCDPVQDVPILEPEKKLQVSEPDNEKDIIISTPATPAPLAEAEPQYEAVWHVIHAPEILSHDPVLNQNGEALHKFLMTQSKEPPQYRVRVRGSHVEVTREVVRTKDSNGHWRTEVRTHTYTIVDFEFVIDLTASIVQGPVLWTLADDEPAYRGQTYKQIDNGHPSNADLELGAKPGLQKATSDAISAAERRQDYRKENGLPPWRGPDFWYEKWEVPVPENPSPLQSSKSLKEWIDEYCASRKILKQFTFTKVIYGWNLDEIRRLVTSTVRCHYTHTIDVEFEMAIYKVRVIPDNALSRMLSHTSVVVLLWLCLAYPFIWLFKRYSRRGGGRWKVGGAAYALLVWKPVPAENVPAGLEFAPDTGLSADGRWKKTASGEVQRLVGETEEQWADRWGPVIQSAVRRCVRSEEPLRGGGTPRRLLDDDGDGDDKRSSQVAACAVAAIKGTPAPSGQDTRPDSPILPQGDGVQRPPEAHVKSDA